MPRKQKLDVSERHELAAKYMPTPEEISAECELIQKTWTKAERRRRSTRREYNWQVPAVREAR